MRDDPIPVHNDILVLPPKGAGWGRATERRGPLVFGLRPRSDDPTHTFVLIVGYWNKVSENDTGTPADLRDGVAQNLKSRDAGSFHSTESNVSPFYRFQGTDCVNYDLVQEERGDANFPSGTVLIVTEHGFFCRHPYSSEIVQAFYSERYKQGDQSLFDGSLKQEAESFLNNIEFMRPSS
jgi:hypothetical protein